jgi:4-phospho-D-threonate 3-dehydrogenase / 4-phospho-D-erythronate 3-dehydrogenase
VIPSRRKTVIAITMGDPAGVGGEVALKALARRLKSPSPVFCFFGDYDYLGRAMKKFKVRAPLVRLKQVDDALRLKGKVGVVDLGGAEKTQWGKISASCGKAAVCYITHAAHAALQGKIDAIVTAPISKDAIHRAGFSFPGHTELLAHLSKTKSFAMMMAGGPFKIVLQSIHISLKESLAQITQPRVWEKLSLTRKTLVEWFGINKPRIAVAGVNPHAGENGAFGNEEIKILRPVVQKARRKGWNVTGPYPPDTLYYWASKGRFDAVLCMYHDQGLIPFKLAVFDTGVNLTLGLPFVRTSPDHGTAFDIAGKGIADPSSMLSAMRLAEKLAEKAR